jgi:hypothetical protein
MDVLHESVLLATDPTEQIMRRQSAPCDASLVMSYLIALMKRTKRSQNA